jgi:acyl-CoA synthetase (AMP-forming)/AMP-acid ligase II
MDDEVWSYRRLDATADRLANLLIGLGVAPGDRVALLDRNSPCWVAVYFAAARCGAILTPLNFWHRAGELAYVLNDSAATIAGSGGFAPCSETRQRRPACTTILHAALRPPNDDLPAL